MYIKSEFKIFTSILLLSIFFIFPNLANAQNSAKNNKESSLIKLGRVKYSGGGDWYNDPSAEVNLLSFIKLHTNIPVNPTYEFVDLASDNLFAYPILFLTGHGNMNLTNQEVLNLRTYLENGGFLYIDDDYGLDEFIRREMKKVFPEQKFIELPFSHNLFHCHFKFENGVPKTHQHDEKPAQTFGLFSKGRLCVVYTYESNPSDGWADPDIHNNTPANREAALKFGTNVVVWALIN
jgi:hypothetical protein